ncbi:MAG: hypothetical protein U5K54_14510 [Cytophagales bacterium]|nr:hypothetical protein [Cytophagales bacterium]
MLTDSFMKAVVSTGMGGVVIKLFKINGRRQLHKLRFSVYNAPFNVGIGVRLPVYKRKQSIKTMNTLRHNSFNQVHKGLRAQLYEAALKIQQTDMSQAEAAAPVIEQIEEVLFLFRKSCTR